jgi:hypothetical protein
VEHCEPTKEDAIVLALEELRQQCMQPGVAARPLFAEIHRKLAQLPV